MERPAPHSAARTRLVETADRLFYAEGIRAVGIDKVIAEAGVAKATLYAHFASKDELTVAVLKHREQAVMAFFAEAGARHRGASGDCVVAFFAALHEWFASPDFRGCAFQNAAVGLADPTHPAARLVREQKQRFREFLAWVVTERYGPLGLLAVPAVAILVEGAVITALVEGSPASAHVARDAALRLLSGLSNPAV